MSVPVFDLHCDTADKLLETYALRKNTAHIDLERGECLPGYAQCFACFTSPLENVEPITAFEKKLAAIIREIEKNPDKIRQAYTADDIEANKNEHIISAILSIEGPAGFGYDPELLEDLYKIGFRFTTLSWNESNPLTGSCVTGGGLTDQGREYVKEAQRLGMVIDVSHISDEGFWDIMNITQAPVVATHSNSRNVCNIARNLTDEMFLEICRTGGVAGINLYPEFLGGASLDDACNHILHFMDLDPTGKHVALGGDLDGIEALPEGFDGIQDYPKLSELLLSRGIDREIIYNIFWNNAIGVMRQCCI